MSENKNIKASEELAKLLADEEDSGQKTSNDVISDDVEGIVAVATQMIAMVQRMDGVVTELLNDVAVLNARVKRAEGWVGELISKDPEIMERIREMGQEVKEAVKESNKDESRPEAE